jgi:hypothetical protein
MLPALGETSWEAAVVERERSVAGDVLWRNGHMDLDWRKTASMMVNGARRWKVNPGVVTRGCDRSHGAEEGEERWVGNGGLGWTQIISYANRRKAKRPSVGIKWSSHDWLLPL